MKTTAEISDPLMIQAKRLAAQQGRALRNLIGQESRQVVAEKPPAEDFRLRRVTFKGAGLQPEMHAAGWDHIRKIAYEEALYEIEWVGLLRL